MSEQAYQREPLLLATGEAHRVELPPRVMRGRLTGFLFETNRSFILPDAMTGIRGLASFYAAHPGLEVLVTGHTDTVGPENANLLLSDERAAAVAAFLVDDVDGWLRHYAGTTGSSRWGTREDQHMLTALPGGGPPYYGGPVHGQLDAATREAVSRFQADHGLAVDGSPGPDTRRALVTDYMALDDTSLPAGTQLQRHGCGEYHNAVPTPDETEEQANRRVEVFFFEGPIEPPPRPRCPHPGCPEYPEWLRRTILTIDFTNPPPRISDPRWEEVDDQTTTELRLRLFDRDRQPCTGRPVTVEIGDRHFVGVSDGTGVARLRIPRDQTAAVARYTGRGGVIERPIRLAVDPVDTDSGARQRLDNLGYPAGGDLVYALAWFQRDRGLPTTGVLDAATRAALTDAHDPGGRS